MGKNFKLQKKTVNIKLYILLKYHFWVQVNDIFQLAGWSKSLSEMIYYDKNKKKLKSGTIEHIKYEKTGLSKEAIKI